MRALLLGLLVLLVATDASAHRTIPHDHTSRGRGGDLGAINLAGGVEINNGTGVTDLDLNGSAAANTARVVVRNNAGGVDLRVAATGTASLRQRSSADSSEDFWIDMTRDADVALRYNNVEVVRTETAANGGLSANNTSTGAGFERVLTTSDAFVNPVTYVYKTITETLNNSATLQDDDELAIALTNGNEYAIELYMIINGEQTADFKFDLGLGGGTSFTSQWQCDTADNAGAAEHFSSNAGTDFVVSLNESIQTVVCRGNIENPLGSVVLTVRWAQDVAVAGTPATQVIRGSWFKATDLGNQI